MAAVARGWDGMGWGGCGGSVTGRGRGSGCFTRPLTFTSPAFQSAVSIKDGCCSSMSPIHHHRAGAADGRLGVMEGERVCWEGGGSEVGRTQLRLQREEFVSSFFWEKCFQVQTEKKKASGEEHPQRAEAAICPGICFAQGGTTVLRWESKCAKKTQQQQQTNKQRNNETECFNSNNKAARRHFSPPEERRPSKPDANKSKRRRK